MYNSLLKIGIHPLYVIRLVMKGIFESLVKKKVRLLILGNLINHDEVELRHIILLFILYDPYFAYFLKGFKVELLLEQTHF